MLLAMLWQAYQAKVAEGVTFDGERVVKMAGQGAVYVRSLCPLEDIDEDVEELLHSAFDTRWVLLVFAEY